MMDQNLSQLFEQFKNYMKKKAKLSIAAETTKKVNPKINLITDTDANVAYKVSVLSIEELVDVSIENMQSKKSKSRLTKTKRKMKTRKFFKNLEKQINQKKNLKKTKNIGCNISIKLYFLHSLLNRFAKNLGHISEEQGECMHQVLRVMEEFYQGFRA